MERELRFFVEPEICTDNSLELNSSGMEECFDDNDNNETEMNDGEVEKTEGRNIIVRLDKWLWAARFFKTRALARAAVEAGKVYYNGERSKPSREIEVGAILQVRHGRFEKTVIVKGLSTRRRSTDEALQLFEETEESKLIREQQAADFSQNQFYQPNNYNHNGGYQEQSSFNHQGNYPGCNQEQKPTRFLRRSFARQESHPERYETRHEVRSQYGSPYGGGRPQRPGTNPYRNQQNNGYHQQPYHNQGNPGHVPHAPYSRPDSRPVNSHHQQGYNNSAYQPQNYNNPVYNNRHTHNQSYHSQHNHANYNNPYHQPRYNNHHNSSYNHPVSNNKTEPQTEFD